MEISLLKKSRKSDYTYNQYGNLRTEASISESGPSKSPNRWRDGESLLPKKETYTKDGSTEIPR